MMNANVKMLSSHAGFSHGADGVQIQVLEDLAIMRALPNVTVLIPADAEQAKQMAIQAADIPGPVYIRLGRQETKLLKSRSGVENPDYFVPGKAQILRPGSDVVLIACGYMVNQCLDVAEELAATGVHICVMNMHTLKPLDTKAILDAASSVKKVITVEEHQKAGGLGSAVAEVLAQANLAVKFRMLGVEDSFGDTAKTTEELWQAYGLGKDAVKEKIKELD
jgi:transketolase